VLRSVRPSRKIKKEKEFGDTIKRAALSNRAGPSFEGKIKHKTGGVKSGAIRMNLAVVKLQHKLQSERELT
jgi:hypothetical protein